MTSCAVCAGDLNGDQHVDLSDLAIVLSNLGCSGGGGVGDLDTNGATDSSDLATELTRYGRVCS